MDFLVYDNCIAEGVWGRGNVGVLGPDALARKGQAHGNCVYGLLAFEQSIVENVYSCLLVSTAAS